ncbi:hypothetical protein [Candidatus Poriferisodalis sp.]|uniref:hypothetical protein n=1 Tax=Candidatus Poriferisodalis sp. TaxID=3101277 RepID=UPI003B5209AD
MHYLQWGLVGLFERDPSAPRFQRLLTPSRKLLGDNPDTVYFEDITHAATDPHCVPAMQIEVIDGTPPPRPSDASVSAGIRRVAAMVRELTVDRPPMIDGEPRSPKR